MKKKYNCSLIRIADKINFISMEFRLRLKMTRQVSKKMKKMFHRLAKQSVNQKRVDTSNQLKG